MKITIVQSAVKNVIVTLYSEFRTKKIIDKPCIHFAMCQLLSKKGKVLTGTQHFFISIIPLTNVNNYND